MPMKSAVLCIGALLSILTITYSGASADPNALPPQPGSQPTDPTKARGDMAAQFNGRITARLSVPDGGGDIYVAGEFSAYRGKPVLPIIRIRPDGSLNDTFRPAEGVFKRIAAMAPADDGSGDVYVADYAAEPARHAGWRFRSTVRRLHADGTPDERFVVATFTHDDIYVPDARFVPVVTGLAPAGDGTGRLYAAGRFGVVRLNRDGSRDAAFRYGTSACHVVPAKDGTGHVYVTSNERIAASGRHASQRILRLKNDGSRDPRFSAGTGVAPAWDIFALVPVEDGTGDLFVGGSFANYGDPNPRGRHAVRLLARINADGSLDRTSPSPPIDERQGAVTALAKADDGSGDWLVTQNQTTIRYRVEGARVSEAADVAATLSSSTSRHAPSGAAD
ncbi:delta-60 repeat domain-containing protein [Nitrospira moscoviensis]|uniref:Glucose/Sorbosone dehydrogenase domain-containing protein n=1 Tax=Nitrospira moscoviensis TaxID=42253 RepID=A0A0K2GAT7_NITMO|nr:delta-60 repeat domain-containing protein [Nitrospira moscoviensis]ALA57712.1 exported protein of unknown function [Nitrospira moscoviensis]